MVQPAARRGAPDPISFEWTVGALSIVSAELVWSVRTNKGWAHLRGLACAADGIDHPFRADIFGPRSVGADGPARIALRVYDAGADPNQASPIVKIQGLLEPEDVDLGQEA